MSCELSPSEQYVEIQEEFMIESANYRMDRLPSTLAHLNALLDAALDMWPELAYEKHE